MRSRIAAGVACSLLVACAVAACGGASGNGVASKSPNQIVASALHAIDSAKSAHISGKVIDGGTPSTLDLTLVTGKGGRGRVSVGGVSYNLEVIGTQVYVNAGSAFWTRLLGTSRGAELSGKWLKVPAKGRFAALAKLTDLRLLLGTVLSPHSALVKGGTTTVNGQSAVAVRDPSGDATIYVATTGEPYPLELVEPGSQGGHITLNHVNESVTLSPPAKSIDVAKYESRPTANP